MDQRSAAAGGDAPSDAVTAIRFAQRLDAALLYHVLAHLDLGRDAANLHDPSLPAAAWTDALLEAYRAAPGRLAIHAAPLTSDERDGDARLRRLPGLQDARGQTLAEAVIDAKDAERARYSPAFCAAPAALVEALATLRAALYEQVGDPPPLTVLDCPPLQLAGRASEDERGRIVAVSLAQDVGHVLCQTIHEEIHAVTDPVVRAGLPRGAAQDTRVGSTGFAVHAELERAAIEVGDALIAARTPEWSSAYARWRGRFGAV